jgi:hypothetical protein
VKAPGNPGEAVARRKPAGRYEPETDERVSAPQEQVAVLHHQLQEAQERMKLAKRLLTRGDRAEPLPR